MLVGFDQEANQTKTRLGELEPALPQVREGGFRPTLFERYQRTEKALLLTLQEMFVRRLLF